MVTGQIFNDIASFDGLPGSLLYWRDNFDAIFDLGTLPQPGDTVIIDSNLVATQNTIGRNAILADVRETFLQGLNIEVRSGGTLHVGRPERALYVNFNDLFLNTTIYLKGGDLILHYSADRTDQDSRGTLVVQEDSYLQALSDFNIIRFDSLQFIAEEPVVLEYAGTYGPATAKFNTYLFREVIVQQDAILRNLGNPQSERRSAFYWHFQNLSIPEDKTLTIEEGPQRENNLQRDTQLILSNSNPQWAGTLVFDVTYEEKKAGTGVGQIIVGAKNGKFAGQGVDDLAPNILGTGTLEVRRGRLQIADFPVFGSVQLPADILGTGRLLFSDQDVTLAIGRPLVKDVELGGTLEISGDNTLFLSGQKKLTIDFDTLKFTEDGGIFSTGSGNRGIHRFENLVVEAAASLSVGSGQFLDFLGGHSDSDAALTLAGVGTVRFLGDTTLAGSLDIEGGVLEVQNGTTLTVGNLITLNETTFEPGLYAVSDLDGFSEIIGSGFINVVESAMSFPLVVQADNFVTDEATSITGNVFADNGSGVDSGEGLFVSEVNEQGIIPNLPITLPSGAQLTIDDEGNFTYDPDGQFSFLNGTEVSTDSFSYTVEDATGQTAQAVVSIDINGIDEPPVGSFQKVGTLIYGLSKNSQEVITFGGSNRKRTTLARTPFIEGDQPANATPELQFSNPDTLYVGTTGVGVIGSGSDTTISGSESLQLRLSGSSDTDNFSRTNTVLLRLRADANTQVLVSGQSSEGETLFSEAVDLTPNLLAGSGDYKVNLRNLIPFQQLQLELGAADGAGPIEGFSLVYARFTVGV